METQGGGCQVQQVAGSLQIGLDSPSPVVIGISKAVAHDEQVLIVVSQNTVARPGIIQVFLAEGITDPRHGDVVQVEQIHLIAVVMSLVVPLVFPADGQDAAPEFRSVLVVVKHRDFGGGIDTPPEVMRQERSNKSRKVQTRSQAVFHKVGVLVAFQFPDGLEGTTQVYREVFRTVEEVTVLVREGGCSAEISCRIGAFRLEGNRRGLVRRKLYVAVEDILVWPFTESNVRIANDSQSSEVAIGVLEVFRGIQVALGKKVVGTQHVLSQRDDGVFGIAAAEPDIPHPIDRMYRTTVGFAVLTVVMQHQRQVYLVRAADTVGTISDKVFVKAEVATIRQILRDALPFAIQQFHAERHSPVQPRTFIILAQQVGNGGILHHIVRLSQTV